jgi:hypothetical protein
MIKWQCPLCGNDNFNWEVKLNEYQQKCLYCNNFFEIYIDYKEIWHVIEPSKTPLKIFNNVTFGVWE